MIVFTLSLPIINLKKDKNLENFHRFYDHFTIRILTNKENDKHFRYYQYILLNFVKKIKKIIFHFQFNFE